jgi:hypothetical protein
VWLVRAHGGKTQNLQADRMTRHHPVRVIAQAKGSTQRARPAHANHSNHVTTVHLVRGEAASVEANRMISERGRNAG